MSSSRTSSLVASRAMGTRASATIGLRWKRSMSAGVSSRGIGAFIARHPQGLGLLVAARLWRRVAKNRPEPAGGADVLMIDARHQQLQKQIAEARRVEA